MAVPTDDVRAGRDWAKRVLSGKPAKPVEADRAKIRAAVEADIAAWETKSKAKADFEAGKRLAEANLATRKSVQETMMLPTLRRPARLV